MTYFKKKFHSQKGASIILALMLFFVCFMVASVILSAATGNADKLRQREKNQKEFLSVSSAANMLKDVLGDVKYIGQEQRKVFLCRKDSLLPHSLWCQDEDSICSEMEFDEGIEARLRKDVERMVYRAFTTHTQYVTPSIVYDKDFEKDFLISGDGMEDIKIHMVLDRDSYVLTCSLQTNDGTDKSNAMTVVFKPDVSIPPAEKDVKTGEDGHDFEVTIENEDGTSSTEWIHRDYDVEVYTIETTVSYNGGTITKGVSS